MINDLIKVYGLFESGQIPIWIAILIIVYFLICSFFPFFKYRLEKYKFEYNIKKEMFEKSERSIGDLNPKREKFEIYLIKLLSKIKSNNVSVDDLRYKIVDSFFGDLITICDGVEKGFSTKTGNISNIINSVLKYKYNKKDNLIIDVYNVMKKAHGIAGRPFNTTLRIDEYDVIFRVYKSGFPFYKRCVGIFYKKIFEIKNL